MDRELEPEAMDTPEEAASYDVMDHRAVNLAFVNDLLAASPTPRRVLDVGTGTGQIPIVLAARAHLARVTGVDLSREMLRLAARNVAHAGLLARVGLACVDAKRLPYAPGDFDVVVSNSVVHHVPEPRAMFAEVARVAGDRAGVFIRDLCRPRDEATVDGLVARYAGGEAEHARVMFRASLCAALTLDEVRGAAEQAGLRGVTVAMTSDRHWTMARV
jgi:ubiquinone/menaquinone biosynthesis C-methylase UbiE